MSWTRSLRLFQFSGVPVELHFSFVLFLAYVAWEGWQLGLDLAARFSPHSGQVLDSDSLVALLVLRGDPSTWAAQAHTWFPWIAMGWHVLLTLVIFTCVVMHEFGHIFAGRLFGIPTFGVTLLPIGGVARMAAIPREPLREFVVAIAGPLVNIAIVAALWPRFGFDLSRVLDPHFLQAFFRFEPRFTPAEFGDFLCKFNLFMACFNLLPIFPMDGGRVARAFLSSFLKPLTATRIVLWLAPLVAGALLLFLIRVIHLQPWITCVLFAFVLTGGHLEYRQLKRQVATKGLRLGDLVTQDYLLLSPSLTVRQALDICRRAGQESFLVGQRGRFHSGRTGLLWRLVLLGRSRTPLEKLDLSCASPRLASAPADEILDLPPRLLPPLIPVYENGLWVGVVNPARFDDSL